MSLVNQIFWNVPGDLQNGQGNDDLIKMSSSIHMMNRHDVSTEHKLEHDLIHTKNKGVKRPSHIIPKEVRRIMQAHSAPNSPMNRRRTISECSAPDSTSNILRSSPPSFPAPLALPPSSLLSGATPPPARRRRQCCNRRIQQIALVMKEKAQIGDM